MNFSPFGTFPQTIATPGVHHFTGAKFSQNIAPGGQVLGVISSGEGGVHYLRPVDNGFNNQPGPQLITLPITVADKPDSEQQPQTIQIQVVNPNVPAINANTSNNNAPKYVMPIQIQGFPQGAATLLTLAYNQQAPGEPLQLQLQSQLDVPPTNESEAEANNNNTSSNNNNNSNSNNNNGSNNNASNSNNGSGNAGEAGGINSTIVTGSNNERSSSNSSSSSGSSNGNVHQATEGMNMEEKSQENNANQTYPITIAPSEMIIKNNSEIDNKSTQTSSEKGKDPKSEGSEEDDVNAEAEEFLQGQNVTTANPNTWQGTAVADYLAKMPGNTLPLSLHHFLRFSAETIKREQAIESSPLSGEFNESYQNGVEENVDLEIDVNGKTASKKKKRPAKKKPPRPKKPRPGQVHIATALDGTTLFCCPECHMAYPEKELLEQHLVGHKIERRFICDICGAGLKRKEHLERHKLGHNPERPFICPVCMKGFKRKEHLNLHAVIHSGEKTEVCTECGKGFYRKDHLRKHAKSHMTKKIKEAAQAQAQTILEAQQLAQQTQFSIPIPNMPGVSVIPINRGIIGEETQSAVVSIKTEIESDELPNLTSMQEPQPQVTITTANTENGAATGTTTTTAGTTVVAPQPAPGPGPGPGPVRQNAKVK